MLTSAQLGGAGLGPRAVRHRVAVGRLRRLQRAVFAVETPTVKSTWIAAVLVAGPEALLSHRSAAALWGLVLLRHDETVAVTLHHSAGRRRPGMRFHCCTTLTHDDRTEVDGIPCTSIARTLLDLAAVIDTRALAQAIDRAEELREFDLAAVNDVLARNRGGRGAGALAAALARHTGPTVTYSEAEERSLEIVTGAELPPPLVNAWIALPEGGGYRPDFLWREERLIVEIDGRTHHARRRAFEHDRHRDRALALAGYETRRARAGGRLGKQSFTIGNPMITAALAPTRERILDAAVELFGRKGYSATSVGEIETAAGLVPRSGALYKHFESKRDLLDAAVARRARVAQRAGELLDSVFVGDVRAELREIGRASLRIVSDDQALMRIVMREGDNFPELRDSFYERIVERGQTSMTAWLRLAAKRSGAPEPDLDGLAALTLGSIINYRVLDTLFHQTPGDLTEERFLDTWTDSTLKLLEAHGLVADEPKEALA